MITNLFDNWHNLGQNLLIPKCKILDVCFFNHSDSLVFLWAWGIWIIKSFGCSLQKFSCSNRIFTFRYNTSCSFSYDPLQIQMLTYGRVMPFVELFARIDAVDAHTVMETAKHFILNKVWKSIIYWGNSLLRNYYACTKTCGIYWVFFFFWKEKIWVRDI